MATVVAVERDQLTSTREVAPELFDAFVSAWGEPVEGVTVGHEASGRSLSVLLFVHDDEPVVRLATHGLGRVPADDGKPLQIELLLTLHRDLGGVDLRTAMEFVFDVAAHLLAHDLRPVPPLVLPPSELSPWLPAALLIDEPLAEPISVASVEADGVHVHLVRLIPIHADEHRFVDEAESTADAVDTLASSPGHDWADLHRPPSPALWLRPDDLA